MACSGCVSAHTCARACICVLACVRARLNVCERARALGRVCSGHHERTARLAAHAEGACEALCCGSARPLSSFPMRAAPSNAQRAIAVGAARAAKAHRCAQAARSSTSRLNAASTPSAAYAAACATPPECISALQTRAGTHCELRCALTRGQPRPRERRLRRPYYTICGRVCASVSRPHRRRPMGECGSVVCSCSPPSKRKCRHARTRARARACDSSSARVSAHRRSQAVTPAGCACAVPRRLVGVPDATRRSGSLCALPSRTHAHASARPPLACRHAAAASGANMEH
jgi:hypothetical protein